MFDFESIYRKIAAEKSGQKKIDVDSSLGVYYGFSPDGHQRLSFLSATIPPQLSSTKSLRVVQGKEKERMYWTCFDLEGTEFNTVFYSFCTNLIESINGAKTDKEAFKMLKKRYVTWKKLFQKEKDTSVSFETIQGLFGELYFLKKYISSLYGIEKAVCSWVGPEGKSKDFSIDQTWYEVKTIGAKASEVRISSIAQLDSDYEGRLVVIKAESMSDEFSNGESSIAELLFSILKEIEDSDTENAFLEKISSFNIDISDNCVNRKFDVKTDGMSLYIVNNSFPRITSKTVPYSEITGVEYLLSISAIEQYKEN